MAWRQRRTGPACSRVKGQTRAAGTASGHSQCPKDGGMGEMSRGKMVNGWLEEATSHGARCFRDSLGLTIQLMKSAMVTKVAKACSCKGEGGAGHQSN